MKTTSDAINNWLAGTYGPHDQDDLAAKTDADLAHACLDDEEYWQREEERPGPSDAVELEAMIAEIRRVWAEELEAWREGCFDAMIERLEAES